MSFLESPVGVYLVFLNISFLFVAVWSFYLWNKCVNKMKLAYLIVAILFSFIWLSITVFWINNLFS